MLGKLVILGFISSLLPVWRAANAPGQGLNVWQYYGYTHEVGDNYGYPHITYSEAVDRARTAWRNRGG